MSSEQNSRYSAPSRVDGPAKASATRRRNRRSAVARRRALPGPSSPITAQSPGPNRSSGVSAAGAGARPARSARSSTTSSSTPLSAVAIDAASLAVSSPSTPGKRPVWYRSVAWRCAVRSSPRLSMTAAALATHATPCVAILRPLSWSCLTDSTQYWSAVILPPGEEILSWTSL